VRLASAGLLFTAIALAGLSASAAPVIVTLTTADGLGADNSVRGGGGTDPDSGLEFRHTNYGGRQVAVLKFIPSGVGGGGPTIDYDNSFTRAAFFRFDLSGIGGTITAATLTLGVRQTELASAVPIGLSTVADGHAQDAAPADGGWEEFGQTMWNSGLLTDEAAMLQAVGAALTVPSTPGPSTDTVVQWSSAHLLAQINADTNGLVTFVVNGAPVILSGSRGVQFWSKENEDGGPIPTLQLTVEQDEVPLSAPPGAALFALGLAAVAWRRRKA
jgi:hypothetical protein